MKITRVICSFAESIINNHIKRNKFIHKSIKIIRWALTPKLLKGMVATVLMFAITLTCLPNSFLSMFGGESGKNDVNAASYEPSAEEIGWASEENLKFGKLGNKFTQDALSSDKYITFTDFVAQNGQGSNFRYGNADNFNPDSVIIVIETANDLYNWSQKCKVNNSGVLDPYAEQKVYLKANYVLGNDINYELAVGVTPVGINGILDSALKFTGTFDGQGFEITNLKLSVIASDYYYSGSPISIFSFFGCVGSAGTVENIGLISPSYSDSGGANINVGGFRCAGLVGRNEGIVRYAFVTSGSARHSISDSSAPQIAGVVHTNTGTVSNVYYAGGIRNDVRQDITYAPVIYENSGTVSQAYYLNEYDGDSGRENEAQSVDVSTLTNRTGILRDGNDFTGKWYNDVYSIAPSYQSSGYPTRGFPRLQGIKFNNNTGWLMRPADLIFFSKALNLAAEFGINVNYRLYRCLNMSGVSAEAYKTPKNGYYGTFDGKLGDGDDSSCPCLSGSHPGKGIQKDNHSIINLRINTYHADSLTQINMGLVISTTNTRTNIPVFNNINFVGGGITLPALTQSQAYGRTISAGMAVAFSACSARFENVHSSAYVTVMGSSEFSNAYMGRLRAGGLLGGTDFGGDAYLNFNNCSGSGDVKCGKYIFSMSETPLYYSAAVGGIAGGMERGGHENYRSIYNVVNYGDVTGVGITDNSDSGTVGRTFVGGDFGYFYDPWDGAYRTFIDGIVNYGEVRSMSEAGNYRNRYFIGGIAGILPLNNSACDTNPLTENGTGAMTRMYNKGDIYAFNIISGSDAESTRVYVSGIGNKLDRGRFYRRLVNTGNILIHNKVLSVYTAGIIAAPEGVPAFNLYKCSNYGSFSDINGTAPLRLSPKYDSIVAGVSINTAHIGKDVVSYASALYCNNYGDIPVQFTNAVCSQVSVVGVAYRANCVSSENLGNLDVAIDSMNSTAYITGVSNNGNIASGNYQSIANDCFNRGNINVVTTKHGGVEAAKLYVVGIHMGRGDQTNTVNTGDISVKTTGHIGDAITTGISGYGEYAKMVNCVNEGDISYTRIFREEYDGMSYSVSMAGLSYGNKYIDVVKDCRNEGQIAYDGYFDPSVSSSDYSLYKSLTYVAGVSVNAYSMERSINNGNIVIAADKNLYYYELYVAGLVCEMSSSNGTPNGENEKITDCINNGNIGNANNMIPLSPDLWSDRLAFSGIAHTLSVNALRCVNTGDITVNNRDPGLEGYVCNINGIAMYVNYVNQYTTELNGIRGQVRNLSNTGNLSYTSTDTPVHQRSRVFIAGVIGTPSLQWNEASLASPTFRYLINYGQISANINVRSSIYSAASPYTYRIINLGIGGIVSRPTAFVTSAATLEFRDCANLNTIDVELDYDNDHNNARGYSYAIGGIVSNMAAREGNASDSYNRQKANFYNCVNGGDINVAANTANSNVTKDSGVGGIAGVIPQYNAAVASESQIKSSISNCINFGDITGGIQTGGIIGSNGTSTKNVVNFGTITSTGHALVGGIIGGLYFNGVSYKTSLPFVLENAVNYGVISDVGVNGKRGGIIGGIDNTWTQSGGYRSFRDIINATNAKTDADSAAAPMFGTQVPSQSTATINNLFDVYSGAYTMNSGYGSFSSVVQAKTVGNPENDTSSIYHETFVFRTRQTIQNRPSLVYIAARQSTQNTMNGDDFLPYKYGIYGVSTDAGYNMDIFMSDNIILPDYNPVLSGEPYEGWNRGIQDALDDCKQKRTNHESEIVTLELKDESGNNSLLSTPVDLGDIEDEPVREVHFYINKDNYYPGTYQVDLKSEYTSISRGAYFESGEDSFDLPEGAVFDNHTMEFVSTLIAECSELASESSDGKDHKNDWLIVFHFKKTINPILLTEVRESDSDNNESLSITNSSSRNFSLKTIDKDQGVDGKYIQPGPEPENGYWMKNNEKVSDVHNTTLIFMLSTVDLQKDINRLGMVWLETEEGVRVNDNSYSYKWNNGVYYDNTTYNKLTTVANEGIESLNYHVRENEHARGLPAIADYHEYKDYYGEMTINVRLHSNLPKGDYRFVFENTYGKFYFHFTRKISSQCEITYSQSSSSAPAIKAKTVAEGIEAVLGSVDSANSLITNLVSNANNQIYYGNAPDFRDLAEPGGTIFVNEPAISYGAAISDLRLVSIKNTDPDKNDGSKTYTFAFTITAEDGTSKEWKVKIVTQPYHKIPTDITAKVERKRNDNGTVQESSYNMVQLQDENIINNYLVFNDVYTTGSFVVKHYLTNGMNGDYRLYNINNDDYYTYKLLDITGNEYTGEGYNITEGGQILFDELEQRYYIELKLDVFEGFETGAYELAVYYKRPPIEFEDEPVVNEAGNEITSISWDNVKYTALKFFKVEGSPDCYVTGIDPVNRSLDISFSCTDDNKLLGVNAPAQGSSVYTFNYADHGTEDNFNKHCEFLIEISFPYDTFYRSYAPELQIPETATLYRLNDDGTWVEVTEDNAKTNFMDKDVVYRVYAEDSRYYQDYVVRLKPISRIKKFNIVFNYENGIEKVPVSAIFKAVSPVDQTDTESEMIGNITVFSDKQTADNPNYFDVEWLPAGYYVSCVQVPYGYVAEIDRDALDQNISLYQPNTFTVDGKGVAGEHAFFMPNTAEVIFDIVINVRKDTNPPPWGIFVEYGNGLMRSPEDRR